MRNCIRKKKESNIKILWENKEKGMINERREKGRMKKKLGER